MKTLHKMILKSFFPIFFFTVLLFILILQMVEIFTNIWRYMENEVTLYQILEVAILYTPKCISYSIPVALLFAVSFTLGNLYANNELIAIFNSGVSLYLLVYPFIIVGVILTIGVFFFEDNVVLSTMEQKEELVGVLLKKTKKILNKSNFSFINAEANTVYKVDFYNDANQTLKGLLIYKWDENRNFLMTIKADRAEWNQKNWVLYNCSIYKWNSEETIIIFEYLDSYNALDMKQEPATFKQSSYDVADMDFSTALQWIENLKVVGLPYTEALTDLYNKFSYALRALIVAFLASSIGGAFKKNILLMSLLSVLGISVAFFIFQMVSDTMAKSGVLPPFVGAFLPFFTFLIVGIILFKLART